MNDQSVVSPVFQKGDEVKLVKGSYQGTVGIFLCFRDDAKWADITEPNGEVRRHPVEWMGHAGRTK